MDTHRRLKLRTMGCSDLLGIDGKPISFPTKKTFLLLTFLALNPDREILRSQLAELVWPDVDPTSARDSLRTALSALRSRLPSGVIFATSETVLMQGGMLDCDALDSSTYPGDFLPGFDQEWVIDQRLALRAAGCEAELAAADEAKDPETALSHVEKACRIDPYHDGAARRKVELLDSLGRRSHAAHTSDRHRARIIREFGVISDIRPQETSTITHPLMSAAEWLLDKSPEDALGMMAATHSEWSLLPVEAALSLHQRVLQSNPESNSSRTLVGAQQAYLLAIAGRLSQQMDTAMEAYRQAESSGENLAASRLASAIAYALLSQGDFQRSLQFARQSVSKASALSPRTVKLEAQQNLGIILIQIGNREQGWRLLNRITPQVEELGTPQMIATHGLLTYEWFIAQGQIDRAARDVERSRRLLTACGPNRSQVWVHLAEALLHESTGDLGKAKEALDELKRISESESGHSVVALADDCLSRINCAMGEMDSAAEAMARATLYRRRMGTVRSIEERENIRQTRHLLKERLGEHALRATYQRASLAFVS